MILNSFCQNNVRYIGKASQMKGVGIEYLCKFETVKGVVILDRQCKPVVKEIRMVFKDGRLATDMLISAQKNLTKALAREVSLAA